MDIREFVTYLRVSKGPGSNGEYLCRCSAHDDCTSSLCVGTGADGRILVKCQAGCDTRDVVKAMGLKMSDLYPEGSKPASGQRRRESRPAPKPLCTFTAITNGVVTRDNGVDEETRLLEALEGRKKD